ncbi:MAG TPA: ATPase domain-containing protein [Nitrososphaerales archaeon]|nr:ATPase domain-containing protein [Nitrososphaerales archaeon]
MPTKGRTVLEPALAMDRLPDELAKFLSRDTFSLVIKGESGTGKTILALTMLKALQPLENVLFVSTRTSPLQLFEYYPWIEEIFGPPGPLKDFGEKERAEGWETLVDSRLDEPNIVFERVTNVLMDKQAPVVVIDSWEALAEGLGSEALRTNIRVLETWRERAGARFIFIGEDPANSTIDYMVEGIVVLKDRTTGGRRLREIMLPKLHGVQIHKLSHFFTLNGGSFRSLPGYSPGDYSFSNPLPIRLDRPLHREKGRIPTGHASLDTVLKGGFPSKSVAFVEVDDAVDAKAGLVLVNKLVQDWASSGGTVVMQRPRGIEEGFVTQYAKSFMGAKAKTGMIVLDGSEGSQRLLERLKPGAKILAVASPQTRGREGAEIWEESVVSLQEMADLTIIFGRPDMKGPAVEGAETRLRLLQIDGTLFLQGEVPWSPLLGVIPTMTAGNPMIQLEPLV